jgi:hypothetical protein
MLRGRAQDAGHRGARYDHEFLNSKFSAIDHSAYPDETGLELLFHLSAFIEQYFGYCHINPGYFITGPGPASKTHLIA